VAVYTRRGRVDAPLSDVWEFHSTVDGLRSVTPGFLDLRVERVTGPGGDPDPAELEEGAEITMSMRPLGVGPRVRWTSRIVERRSHGDEALFADEMVEGPFSRWRHVHRFAATDGATVVEDRVEYRLPGGRAGALVSPLAWVGFEPLFAYRHRRTRSLLEQ